MKKKIEKGLETTKDIWGYARADLIDDYEELGEIILEHAFCDIYSRGILSLRDRELITVSMIISQGGNELQLKNHMKAAINVGITKEELFELVLQSYVYNGFPKAINAFKILKEITYDI